mgnify:CR=1 FL=1
MVENVDENVDANVDTLILSILSTSVIIFFSLKILSNLSKLIYNYYSAIYKKYNITTFEDNNKYIEDDKQFKNKSNEILKNISSIKLQHKKEFNALRKYKTTYNLDNINYSEINNKILSKKFDDYEYNNQPNFINFIIDIFKPTKN